MVDYCPRFLGEGVPNNQISVTQSGHKWPKDCLRLDTTTNDIDSPGCANQRVDQRVLENYGFDRLEGIVGCSRGQNGFPQGLIDPGRVDGGAEKSVVEHVVYVVCVIVIALCRTMDRVPLNSLAGMGLASISVIKAAKRPMLWVAHQRWARGHEQTFPPCASEECSSDPRGMPLTSKHRNNLSL